MYKTLIAAVMVATCSASIASAETAPSKTVVVARADVADTASTGALYDRMKSAARRVCESPFAGARTANADAACYRKALNGAVRDVNQPAVTAMHVHSNSALASQDF